MDVQSLRNIPRLNLWKQGNPYRLNLELVAVAMNLLRTDRRCHLNPLKR
jgi:hypothetical protein